MLNRFMQHWKTVSILLCFLAGGIQPEVRAESCTVCRDGQSPNVQFYLRGVGWIAGTATITVSYGDTVLTTTMTGGSVKLGGNGYYADRYDCVEWAQDIAVQPKVDQPVLVKYSYVQDPMDPAFTAFQPMLGNPTTYWSRPSSKCLKVYFDSNDGKWFPEVSVFSYFGEARIKGVLVGDDSNLGDSILGPTAGGGAPVPNTPDFMDAPPIGTGVIPCPGTGGFPQALSSPTTSIAQTSASSTMETGVRSTAAFMLLPPQLKASHTDTMVASTFSGQALTNQPKTIVKQHQPLFKNQALGFITNLHSFATGKFRYALGTTNNASKLKSSKGGVQAATASRNQNTAASILSSSDLSPNGYTVAQQIGRLRWEMSLGSIGRALTLGRMIYQADALDATAYLPARLSLAAGSDPADVVLDTSGYLRQVVVNDGLVDITPISSGFQVAVYPMAQVGSPDPVTHIYPFSGDPALTWTVQNPDATPLGRVRFTKLQGGNTQVHIAQWEATAGTMTITRYNDKWKEVRAYSLSTDGTQRTETISSYKQDVLQHKVREVYQQFYNWGNPGDIYEAVVQRVEDPDGKALTTIYTYLDQPSQPGNELGQVTYPDGYSEIIPTRAPNMDFWPIVIVGDPVSVLQPFKDNDAGTTAGRKIDTSYSRDQTDDHIVEITETTVNGYSVGKRRVDHYYNDGGNGIWEMDIRDFTDNNNNNFAAEVRVLDIGTRQPIVNLNRDGRTETFVPSYGFWDPTRAQFLSYPSAGSVPALQTMIVYGSADHQYGIAGRTTVEIKVEDNFGHLVQDNTYLGDGIYPPTYPPTTLIDSKISTYTGDRLTATHRNGRLIYQAAYNPDGTLQWEQDESGRVTEYLYDEMQRVRQRTLRGRSGDANQVTTYEYDVQGHKISEITTAGTLTTQSQWTYNLAGELVSTVGPDGLTDSLDTSYTSGFKVQTETLPTQATKTTSYFKDRRVRSVTGNAVEDEYYDVFIALWSTSPSSYREGTSVYRDSAMTQLKQTRLVNWVGDEIFLQTPQFGGVGYRNRYTYYSIHSTLGSVLPLVAKVTETGRATQLATYDELGVLTAQGLDLDNNGTLDAISTEPITVYSTSYANDAGLWQEVSTVQRYLQDNDDTLTLVQRTRTTVPKALEENVLASSSIERPGGGTVTAATTTVVLDPATGAETTTANDQELGQVQTRVVRDGLLRSETKQGITTPWTYTYTDLGELQTASDPLTGTRTYAYDSTTRRLSSITDSLSRETDYDYYPAGAANAGRIRGVRDPAGKWTYFDYHPAGQLYRRWGLNTYPIQQIYDEAGRMTALTTFRTTPGTVNWDSSTWPNPPAGDVTQWVYDGPSGLLQRKVYADAGTGPKTVVYTYNSGNFLATKVNGRGQTITYNIDTTGKLRNVTYSDPTPAVTLDYDRAGRLRSVTDGSGMRNITWTDRDQMKDETYTAGLLLGVAVTRGFDSKFRQETVGLSLGGAAALRQRTTFDAASWVDYITDETPDGATVLHKFDYAFKPGTPFVQSVSFSRGTTPVMTDNYTRDALGRFSAAGATFAGGATINNVSYLFDDLDRRYEADLTDGTKWTYNYDNRSQVTSGKRQLASGAMAGGEQFEYDYDDIGNRSATRVGGDATGASLRSASYSVNSLNQYTSRSVQGSAPGSASVWLVGEAPLSFDLEGMVVGGQPFAIQRQDGNRFFGEASVPNDSAAYAQLGVRGGSGGVWVDLETVNEFVPQTPETFTYDYDGNLTSDGRWTYTWDAENRLTSVTARADIPDAAKRKVEFVYDHTGRRVQKTVSTWNGSDYEAQNPIKLVYDGWNLLAVLNSDLSLSTSYRWGLDLSGTMQGAGGVGGLLSMTVHSGSQAGTYYYTFDGNGNVQALVNAASGTIAAQYEYGPFGELLRATGPMAKANPFRFSTKYQDDETDLLCYGYRYYNPSSGRWLNRDPIEEDGGKDLYEFVGNDGINYIDPLGLRPITAQEQAVLDKLTALADGTKEKDPEFSKAMNAVIADIKSLILSVKGPQDPANLRIGLSALKIWADPNKAKFYAHGVGANTATCHKYVADVVRDAGFDVSVWSFAHFWHPAGTPEWHDPRELKAFKIIWIIRPIKYDGKRVAIEWEQPLMGKGEGRAPTFGDVISYPGHVGIYLGRKIYVSSTTWEFRKDLQGIDVVIHITNDNQEQIYRSPK